MIRSLGFLCIFTLALAAFGSSSIGSEVGSQQEDSVLPPPRVGLLSLPYPDTEPLEEQVREQFRELQRNLAKLVRKPETTKSQLSEAYGLLGQMYHAYALSDVAEICYLNAHRVEPKDFTGVSI